MSSISEAIAREELRTRLITIGRERREATGNRDPEAELDEFQSEFWGDLTPDEVQSIRDRVMNDTEPDSLLTDLARLLTDPRVPDAYAESVRSQLHEMVYQLKAVTEGVVIKEQAA